MGHWQIQSLIGHFFLGYFDTFLILFDSEENARNPPRALIEPVGKKSWGWWNPYPWFIIGVHDPFDNENDTSVFKQVPNVHPIFPLVAMVACYGIHALLTCFLLAPGWHSVGFQRCGTCEPGHGLIIRVTKRKGKRFRCFISSGFAVNPRPFTQEV